MPSADSNTECSPDVRFWRIAEEQWAATAFSGIGAARYPGRWNPLGLRMVYASESMALAGLEVVAHLGSSTIARVFVAIEAELPDAVAERVRIDTLPRDWHSNLAVSREFGAAWIASGSSVVLLVPSVLPGSGASAGSNVLINPAHPGVEQLAVVSTERFFLDRRLLFRPAPPAPQD